MEARASQAEAKQPFYSYSESEETLLRELVGEKQKCTAKRCSN